MHKAGIIGHFGFGLNLANGQTIKTKIITESLKEYDSDILTIDAHGGFKAIIPVVLGCIKSLLTCKNVVIMLTENGLKVTVPVLAILNKFFHRKLHYIVIGGWLPKFLDKQDSLKKFLKEFNYIYVETNTMRLALEDKGFCNIVVMPNAKKLDILAENKLVTSTEMPLALCTFSRVMKEKGIETIVEIVKKINESLGKTAFKLDIYGQIDQGQLQWFENLKKSFPEYISYGGVVAFDQSVSVLKNYFALIFPTHFFTEGIPGTIIDAYAAGVPVISAKWESFADVISEGETGFGYTFDDSSELEHILRSCLKKPERVNMLKGNCLRCANAFSLNEVMKIFTNRL